MSVDGVIYVAFFAFVAVVLAERFWEMLSRWCPPDDPPAGEGVSWWEQVRRARAYRLARARWLRWQDRQDRRTR